MRNNEFSDEFDQENELNFQRLLKKTRRKTTLRNILISIICTLVILTGILIADRVLLARSLDSAYRDLFQFNLISGPNVLMGEIQSVDGMWGGTAEYKTYKVIEGVPIPWAANQYKYNILGNHSLFNGGYSPISVIDPDMISQGMNFARSYNVQNGQRELLFYHPDADYPKVLNELDQLDQINPEKKVELAISLDHAYTSDEIRSMLPAGVHARWFWVDTYTKDYVKFLNTNPKLPIGTPIVYGYAAYADNEEKWVNNEEKFISFVKEGLKLNGNYDYEYRQIFDRLRGNKEEPEKEDVHNIGVVVTGSPDALQALQAEGYVRASVLGAIIEKY